MRHSFLWCALFLAATAGLSCEPKVLDPETQAFIKSLPLKNESLQIKQILKVKEDHSLIFRFGEPMVMLEAVQRPASFDSIKLYPECEGEWQWLDPLTLQFAARNKTCLTDNTQMSILAGIESLLGNVLLQGQTHHYSGVVEQKQHKTESHQFSSEAALKDDAKHTLHTSEWLRAGDEPQFEFSTKNISEKTIKGKIQIDELGSKNSSLVNESFYLGKNQEHQLPVLVKSEKTMHKAPFLQIKAVVKEQDLPEFTVEKEVVILQKPQKSGFFSSQLVGGGGFEREYLFAKNSSQGHFTLMWTLNPEAMLKMLARRLSTGFGEIGVTGVLAQMYGKMILEEPLQSDWDLLLSILDFSIDDEGLIWGLEENQLVYLASLVMAERSDTASRVTIYEKLVEWSIANESLELRAGTIGKDLHRRILAMSIGSTLKRDLSPQSLKEIGESVAYLDSMSQVRFAQLYFDENPNAQMVNNWLDWLKNDFALNQSINKDYRDRRFLTQLLLLLYRIGDDAGFRDEVYGKVVQLDLHASQAGAIDVLWSLWMLSRLIQNDGAGGLGTELVLNEIPVMKAQLTAKKNHAQLVLPAEKLPGRLLVRLKLDDSSIAEMPPLLMAADYQTSESADEEAIVPANSTDLTVIQWYEDIQGERIERISKNMAVNIQTGIYAGKDLPGGVVILPLCSVCEAVRVTGSSKIRAKKFRDYMEIRFNKLESGWHEITLEVIPRFSGKYQMPSTDVYINDTVLARTGDKTIEVIKSNPDNVQ